MRPLPHGVWLRGSWETWSPLLGEYYAVMLIKVLQRVLLAYVGFFLSLIIGIACVEVLHNSNSSLPYLTVVPLFGLCVTWLIISLFGFVSVGHLVRDDLRRSGFSVSSSPNFMQRPKLLERWCKKENVSLEVIRQVGMRRQTGST